MRINNISKEGEVMKICFIVGAFFPMKCGVGDYTLNLAKNLSKSGNDTFVITSKNATNEEIEGVKVYNIVDKWDFSSLKSINNVIKLINPDIVHIQYPSDEYGKSFFINILPLLIRKKFKVNIVETVHEYLSYTSKGKLRNLINYKVANKIIVVEKRYINIIKGFIPKISKNLNIEYIPISSNIPVSKIDADTYIELKNKLGLLNNKVIVYFGFINELKGFEVLLKAIYELKKIDSNIMLLVLSNLDENNEYHRSIMKLIDNLNLNENIIITGFIDSAQEVSNYIKIADLSILPFRDGLSERNGSFLAVYLQGIPIITTTNDNTEDNNGVFYVKPNDVENIVSYSSKILNDCNRYERKVIEWNDIVKEHLEIYKIKK